MYIYIYIYIYINNTKYNIYIKYNIKWAGLVRPNRLGRSQPKIVGPISAQTGLGRSRPKKNYHFLLGQTRPRRQGWARIRLAQAKTGRGELFSPHPCMQNATRSECGEGKRNERENEGGRKVTWRGGGCASLAVLRQRLVA